MKYVLILSREYDPHVPPVVKEIQARGAGVLWLNLSDFPEHVLLQTSLDDANGWSGTITYRDQQVDLASLTGIWWRRPKRYQAPQAYSPGERAFLEEEANRSIIGILESLRFHQTLWVSRVHCIRRADLKPLQLAAAQQLGLRVPRTLLTNQPDAARSFFDACQGAVVLKAVSRGSIEDEDQKRFIHTSRVEQEHLSFLERVRANAHLFQQYIPKSMDLRVVVIGRQVFAAEIHSQHSQRASVDFRQGYGDLSYAVHDLPGSIEEKVLALVRSFDLQFSSMDFAVTPDGDYYFLDLNPNGQWYWLQLRLADRFPLKEAMANLLVFPEDYRL